MPTVEYALLLEHFSDRANSCRPATIQLNQRQVLTQAFHEHTTAEGTITASSTVRRIQRQPHVWIQ